MDTLQVMKTEEGVLRLYRRAFCFMIVVALAGSPVMAEEASQAPTAPPASHQDMQAFKKKVLVTVNGVAITVGQVEQAVSSYVPQAVFHQSVSEEKMASYRKQALQSLIYSELLYQESQKKGLKVEDDFLDKKINELIEKYGGKSQFEDVLKSNGYTLQEYREVLRRSALVEQVNEKGYGAPLGVTDDAVRKYYEENKERFVEPEKVKVSHILIKVNPSSSREQFENLIKKSEMILAKAKEEGADFAALAKEFSDDSSKEAGGDLGYVHRGRLEPEFEDAAFSMDVGEVRGIVRTLYGFHILKVEGKIAPRQVEYEQIKDKLKKDLQRDAENKARRDWLKDLWDKAEIKYATMDEN